MNTNARGLSTCPIPGPGRGPGPGPCRGQGFVQVQVQNQDQVRSWLTSHPRFQFHFTPVHCSWMNQVEQWFSILQRKRLKAPNFADLEDLELKITAFIEEWNEAAHPFRWTTESFSKILNKIDSTIKAAA